jgi:transketolase
MTDLRQFFFDTLLEIAREDCNVILLTGDLGFSFIERFQAELPLQFINCGIAEQNMVGVAAGLALGGKKPYCYSGAVFMTMRPYEFIRDDVAYNNLNVKMIGTGAGGFLGFSHNMLDSENERDLLKNLPNLSIYMPTSEEELEGVLIETHRSRMPAYIRL